MKPTKEQVDAALKLYYGTKHTLHTEHWKRARMECLLESLPAIMNFGPQPKTVEK